MNSKVHQNCSDFLEVETNIIQSSYDHLQTFFTTSETQIHSKESVLN